MREVRQFRGYRNRPIRGFDQGSEPEVAISVPVNHILVDIYQYQRHFSATRYAYRIFNEIGSLGERTYEK